MEIELPRSRGRPALHFARQNVFRPEKKPQIKELQMHADLITHSPFVNKQSSGGNLGTIFALRFISRTESNLRGDRGGGLITEYCGCG